MPGTARQRILSLAEAPGTITASAVSRAGIHRQELTRLVADGTLERVGPGRYRLANAEVTEHQGLATAAAVAPDGVICLLSALSFHGIGSQLPAEVWLAIERGRRPPKLATLRLRIVRFSGPSFTKGSRSTRSNGSACGSTASPTRDADLLGFGELDVKSLRTLFSDVCTQPVGPDGLELDPESLRVAPIRVEDAYGGTRVDSRLVWEGRGSASRWMSASATPLSPSRSGSSTRACSINLDRGCARIGQRPLSRRSCTPWSSSAPPTVACGTSSTCTHSRWVGRSMVPCSPGPSRPPSPAAGRPCRTGFRWR
jgi:hypothetical protein